MMGQQIVITLDLPAIPLEEYARRSGQTLDACRHQVKSGQIPTMQEKPGAKVYVNLIAMHRACLESATWNMSSPSQAYSI